MIYLPVAFSLESARVTSVEFATQLASRKGEKEVRHAQRVLGNDEIAFSRHVHCLQRAARETDIHGVIAPPEMQFRTEGYWAPVGPGEIGQDKHGNAVVGRTWVARLETWAASNPSAFLVHRIGPKRKGPDPGIIYVMRSGGNDVDLYKVGLTRRNPDTRAKELSGTSVALPFGVLATWDVGDCSSVERESHARLKAYRINPEREFFCARLDKIIAVVNDVVAEVDARHGS
jgi:hypothetical protein